MKLFKSSIYALAALSVVAFSACSDDDQYKPGDPSTGLYFEGTGDIAIEANPEETSVSVPVYRQGITDAASYTINVVSEDSDLFEIPSNTVTFAQGESVAEFVIGYNAENLSPTETYTIELQFADGVPSCAYGSSVATLTIQVAKSFGDLESLQDYFGIGGEDCTWFYEVSISAQVAGISTDPGLPISIRYNENNPDEAQFLIEHWFGDQPLYIDFDNKTYDTHIPWNTWTGYQVNTQEYGVAYFYCTDAYTYLMLAPDPDNHDEELAQQFKDASWYDPETGTFHTYMIYYAGDGKQCSIYGMGYETCQVSGFADYVPVLEYAGVMASADMYASYALVNYTMSEDVEKLVLLASDSMTGNDLINAILAEDDNCTTVTGTSGQARVKLDGSGTYTCVGVTYGKGEPQQAVSISFTTMDGLPEDVDTHWPIVGTAQLVDGWITPRYFEGELNDEGQMTTEADSWIVDVRESLSNPGMYRLVSPWTQEDCPVVANNANKQAADLFIDATNPEVVKINPQYSGFTAASDKRPYYICNYAGTTAGQKLTDDKLLASKFNTQLDGNIINMGYSFFGTTTTIGTSNTNYLAKDKVPYSTIIILDVAPISKTVKKAISSGQNYASKHFVNRVDFSPRAIKK